MSVVSSSPSSTPTSRPMIKEPPKPDQTYIAVTTNKTHKSRLKLNRNISSVSLYSPKFSIYILVTCALLFIIFQIQSLHNSLPPSPPSSSPLPSYTLMYHIQKYMNQTLASTNFTKESESMSTKLRESITFLPLKDLRYSSTAHQGHTWFMSSMYDTHEEGEVQYQQFPSPSSKGRLLCLMGNDTHDGSNNYYALAWPETLPENSTLMRGLTFVSYNHYNYDNIWHGLSAMVPFVAWHKKNHCELPSRWVLYHWGELRMEMCSWLNNLMGATFNGSTHVETFDGIGGDQPVCFEKAVVMRHNEGGMSRDRRLEVYDLMRCKAKLFCNLSLGGRIAEVDHRGLAVIRMTMFMRTGPRSFKNESAVIKIFESECAKVDGCKLAVAYSNNLSFCEQVELMGSTDILISPHGAQLTNMFFMDRNSTVMEFFPKGWLKVAGVGQYVYHWIASWSGMRHRGAWRDPDGETCPYADDDRRCMSVYKDGRIGHNETYFSEWAKIVLNEVKMRKMDELKNTTLSYNGYGNSCSC